VHAYGDRGHEAVADVDVEFFLGFREIRKQRFSVYEDSKYTTDSFRVGMM
jgi:hypothetical protein